MPIFVMINHLPRPDLPTEARNEVKLLSECSCSHQPLKFNLFIVDNR